MYIIIKMNYSLIATQTGGIVEYIISCNFGGRFMSGSKVIKRPWPSYLSPPFPAAGSKTEQGYIACVARVSVCFRRKERPRNGIFGFVRERNGTRAKKKRGGGGRQWERKERLIADKTRDFENPARQQTRRLIGSASRTLFISRIKGLFHNARS